MHGLMKSHRLTSHNGLVIKPSGNGSKDWKRYWFYMDLLTYIKMVKYGLSWFNSTQANLQRSFLGMILRSNIRPSPLPPWPPPLHHLHPPPATTTQIEAPCRKNFTSNEGYKSYVPLTTGYSNVSNSFLEIQGLLDLPFYALDCFTLPYTVYFCQW